jgi:hypothetical protein
MAVTCHTFGVVMRHLTELAAPGFGGTRGGFAALVGTLGEGASATGEHAIARHPISSSCRWSLYNR